MVPVSQPLTWPTWSSLCPMKIICGKRLQVSTLTFQLPMTLLVSYKQQADAESEKERSRRWCPLGLRETSLYSHLKDLEKSKKKKKCVGGSRRAEGLLVRDMPPQTQSLWEKPGNHMASNPDFTRFTQERSLNMHDAGYKNHNSNLEDECLFLLGFCLSWDCHRSGACCRGHWVHMCSCW